MKKNRLIFFSIFAAYHVIVFAMTLYVKYKQADFGSLLSLLSSISMFMYGALIGLILFLTDFIWSWKVNRDNASNEEALRLENNTLKAKIYDLQEGKKEKAYIPPASA